MSSLYLKSRLYDGILFIYSPLISFVLVYGFTLSRFQIHHPFEKDMPFDLFLDNIFVTAHVFLTLFRSHLRPEIFSEHKSKFIWIPLLILLLSFSSDFLLVTTAIVVALWDVYHIGMQNYGLARLYERKNPTQNLDDQWDLGLALVGYLLPIASSTQFFFLFTEFEIYKKINWLFLAQAPQYLRPWQAGLTHFFQFLTIVYLLSYCVRLYWLRQKGILFSWPKVALLINSSLCHFLAFSFNPWGRAWTLVSVYHIMQYYGIIWLSEKSSLKKRFKFKNDFLLGFSMLVITVAIGFIADWSVIPLDQTDFTWSFNRLLLAFFLVMNLFHFYWDSIIWKRAYSLSG